VLLDLKHLSQLSHIFFSLFPGPSSAKCDAGRFAMKIYIVKCRILLQKCISLIIFLCGGRINYVNKILIRRYFMECILFSDFSVSRQQVEWFMFDIPANLAR